MQSCPGRKNNMKGKRVSVFSETRGFDRIGRSTRILANPVNGRIIFFQCCNVSRERTNDPIVKQEHKSRQRIVRTFIMQDGSDQRRKEIKY